jgi:hypothetical protein
VRSLSSKTLDVYSIDEQVVNNERICTPGCGHSGNQLQEKNPETKSQMMMRISSPLEEGLCTNDSPASKLPDLDTPVSSSASRYLPKKKRKRLISTHNLKKQIYAAKEAIHETLSSKKRITEN